MAKMPCRISDGKQSDDGETPIENCPIHGDYDVSSGVYSCPHCDRKNVLRLAALSGLQVQLQRVVDRNVFDKRSMIEDLKRAIDYLRYTDVS